MSRYKDRKYNRTYMFVGSDIFADGTARGNAKNIYEPGTNIVNNWDVTEGCIDYVFRKLGIDGTDGTVERPIVMTETVANLGYARKSEFCFTIHALANDKQPCQNFSLNATARLQ
jgi:actin-related protein 5